MELTAIVFFTSCYFLILVPLGIHYMFGNDVMLRRLGEAQQPDQGLSRWIWEPSSSSSVKFWLLSFLLLRLWDGWFWLGVTFAFVSPACWRRCVALQQLIKSGGSAHQSYAECSEPTTNWVCSHEGWERRGTLTFFMIWMKISVHSFSVRGNTLTVLMGLGWK